MSVLVEVDRSVDRGDGCGAELIGNIAGHYYTAGMYSQRTVT
jgi:hypothetical protein